MVGLSTVPPVEPNEAAVAGVPAHELSVSSRSRDDRFAAALRGFGPIGLIAIVFIILAGNVFVGNFAIPLGGLFVLLWASRSGTPWNELGYVRPKSWAATIAIGLALGVAFKFAMKALVMPLFGADPVNQTYRHLAGNSTALPAAIWTMVVAAGFGEETVFRGFAFERMRRLIGWSAVAKALTVVVTAIVFGVAHYRTQGTTGVQQGIIVALVFGTIYARTGRIWVPIIAHAAFDLTALAMIYFDVEAAVANLVFK
jgi:uncharacterized protein